jgi:antitoxin component of RelBE/YafQ-DinJ toxin-antitoxin module
MLALVEEKYTWCPLGLSHIPNNETITSIEESESGKGVKSFDSMDDLYKDLGI